MENKNKPQWLIDAENEIKNFENTEYGKLSDKEFNFKQKQSNAGSSGGSITKERRSGGFFLSEVQRELSSRRKSFGPGHNFTNEERSKGHDHENSFKNKKVVCSICGCSTTTGNHTRWHEDKCKLPLLLEIYNKLNDTFDRKDLENVTIKVGISKSIMNNFIYGFETHRFCTIIDTIKRNIIYKKI